MDGQRCVYEPSVPELSGYSIDVQFCAVEPDIFEIITGQTLVFDAQGRLRHAPLELGRPGGARVSIVGLGILQAAE